MDISSLVHVNAVLNTISAVLVLTGYTLIKNGKRDWHKRLMITAFFTSTLFLVSYLSYHTLTANPKHYDGELPLVYFPILISHIVLAPVIVPFVLYTLYCGLKERLDRHVKFARITFPLWIYVSITGIIIYLMLY